MYIKGVSFLKKIDNYNKEWGIWLPMSLCLLKTLEGKTFELKSASVIKLYNRIFERADTQSKWGS